MFNLWLHICTSIIMRFSILTFIWHYTSIHLTLSQFIHLLTHGFVVLHMGISHYTMPNCKVEVVNNFVHIYREEQLYRLYGTTLRILQNNIFLRSIDPLHDNLVAMNIKCFRCNNNLHNRYLLYLRCAICGLQLLTSNVYMINNPHIQQILQFHKGCCRYTPGIFIARRSVIGFCYSAVCPFLRRICCGTASSM